MFVKTKKARALPHPENFRYEGLPGLSHEVAQKLEAICPITLGQASRISGITPSAISLIMLLLEKNDRLKQEMLRKSLRGI